MGKNCAKCGKVLDEWDEKNQFVIGFTRKKAPACGEYSMNLSLCSECFDAIAEGVLQKNGTDCPCAQVPKEGVQTAEEYLRVLQSLKETKGLHYDFRRQYLKAWQGYFMITWAGEASKERFIKLGGGKKMWFDAEIQFEPFVYRIGARAFAGSKNLEAISLGRIGEIGEGAFADCTSLSAVWLPRNLSKVQAGAFRGCINLRFLLFEGKETEWNEKILKGKIVPDGNEPLLEAQRFFDCSL